MLLRNKISLIGQELFQVFLIISLLLILSEIFWAGSVTNYFNFNFLAVACLITGVMMISSKPTKDDFQEYQAIKKRLIIKTFDMILVKKSK